MKKAFAMAMVFLLSLSSGTVAFAGNGQGLGYGREDTVNINDYSTDNWDRFSFNYQFASGMETKDDANANERARKEPAAGEYPAEQGRGVPAACLWRIQREYPDRAEQPLS